MRQQAYCLQQKRAKMETITIFRKEAGHLTATGLVNY